MYRLTFSLILLLCSSALADSINVRMSDPSLKINFEEFIAYAETCTLPIQTAALKIEQLKCQYSPFVSVAVVGSSVEIRNADQLKHNAFAKQPNRFDLGKQLSNASGTAQLPAAGVTRIQCRFHPKMMAQILVLKNNCFASFKNGVAKIQGVPSGENKIKLWSPHLKEELEVTTKTVTATFSIAETNLAQITPVIGCPVDAPSEY